MQSLTPVTIALLGEFGVFSFARQPAYGVVYRVPVTIVNGIARQAKSGGALQCKFLSFQQRSLKYHYWGAN